MDSSLAISILLMSLPVGFGLAVGVWGGIKVASRWYGPLLTSSPDTMAQVADALREVADAISALPSPPEKE